MVVTDMKGHKIELTEKQRAYLAKHFKNTKNKDLAEKLGISLRSVVRIGREMGLTKTKQFMRKTQANCSAHSVMSYKRMKVENPERYVELREIGLRNLKAGWRRNTTEDKGMYRVKVRYDSKEEEMFDTDDRGRIALPSGTWVPPDESVYEDDAEEIYRGLPKGGMRMPD